MGIEGELGDMGGATAKADFGLGGDEGWGGWGGVNEWLINELGGLMNG